MHKYEIDNILLFDVAALDTRNLNKRIATQHGTHNVCVQCGSFRLLCEWYGVTLDTATYPF